jgi:hypothetical protein
MYGIIYVVFMISTCADWTSMYEYDIRGLVSWAESYENFAPWRKTCTFLH